MTNLFYEIQIYLGRGCLTIDQAKAVARGLKAVMKNIGLRQCSKSQEKALRGGRRNDVLRAFAQLSDGLLDYDLLAVCIPAWAARKLTAKAQEALKKGKSQKEWHFGADSDCGADESPFACLKGLLRQSE